MFIARTGPQASTPVASVGAVIDDLLARVTSGPEVELHRELDATGIDLRQAETVLLRKISRSTVNEQRAIVRVLAHCGSRRSMPALLKLARREAIRDEALASLESIVGLERLAAQLDVAGDEHVRQAIIERLLAADSEAARRAYLSLVATESTRREALAVARQLPEPPINSWLENLDDDDESVRLSAALVLSTVNGPEVTRSLIDRVTARPADSTEAWIALLGCRGEMADEFCAYAMQRPKLLGYFNGARLRWARMTP
jgi:HEAT repeat protein